MEQNPNPYQPPDAELVGQEEQPQQTPNFGSLESGLAGNYRLDPGEILKEAWELVNGSKLMFLGAYILSTVFGLVGNMLLQLVGLDGQALVQQGRFLEGYGLSLLSGMILTPITVPIYAGIFMLALKRAAGEQHSFADIFAYYIHTPKLVVLSLMSTLLMYLGFALLVVPGLYLMIAYMLAIPVMLDKDLSPWQALEASRKAITHQWFSVFGLLILVGVIITVSTLLCLVPLFWTAPLMMMSLAVMYRIIFGYGKKAAF